MSRKTNISKKPVVRDYGIQSYRAGDKKDYSEIIGTPTFFAANAATVVRESEFAKPYDESEDYSGMEYPAPNWPGTDWPGIDYPNMGLPVPDFPGMYDPWHMNFRCDVSPCWCEGETKTFAANCTHEIISAHFAPSEDDLSVAFSKSTISITAASGIRSGESGYLTITMKANVPKGGSLWQGKYNPVHGTHSSISVSECWGSICCDDSGMAWAGPETINQDESKSVAITDSLGNGGPYSWSVSGSGFTLDHAETTGLTNMLNADVAACGTATVTVTGCGGTIVTGYVRCTTGNWTEIDSCTNVASCGGVCGSAGCDTIVEKYKYHDQYCTLTLGQEEYCAAYCPPTGNCSALGDSCVGDLFGFCECSVRYTKTYEWTC